MGPALFGGGQDTINDMVNIPDIVKALQNSIDKSAAYLKVQATLQTLKRPEGGKVPTVNSPSIPKRV